MNKLILLGLAATVGAAKLAFLPVNPPVELQPTSPGTIQTGHLNISGTATVGLLKSQGTVFGQAASPTGISYGGFFTAASNQARGFYGFASSTTGLTYGGFFQNASDQGRAVYGLATSTTGINYGGYFQTASVGGRAVFGVATAASGATFGVYGRSNSPTGYGVYSEGNMAASGVISGNGGGLTNLNATFVTSGKLNPARLQVPLIINDLAGANEAIIEGINVGSASASIGVRGRATNGVGLNFGGYFRSDSTGGTGVYGLNYSQAGSGLGGAFDTYSPTGYGARGHNWATSGTGAGLYGTSDSPAGFGGYFDGAGVALKANSTTNDAIAATTSADGRSAIFAKNTSTGTSLITYGLYAEATSRIGIGVRGFSNGADGYGGSFGGFMAGLKSSSSTGDGVVAQSDASGKSAIWARNNATSGLAYGVVAESMSGSGIASLGTNYGVGGYGVYGAADNTGWAVWANGRLGASGTKSFRIDHPADPQNRYLLHYSAEGPDVLNLYTGNVRTDDRGYATIQLPEYFGDINKDPRYTLTVVDSSDDFVMAKVVKEVHNNQFTIRTSKASVKVSWEVKALRNDKWIQRYGAPVEADKRDDEKGKFLHPELYGFGPEQGLGPQRTKRPPLKELPEPPQANRK